MRDVDGVELLPGDAVVYVGAGNPFTGTIVSELPAGRCEVLLGDTDPETLLDDPEADEAADLAALASHGPHVAIEGPAVALTPGTRVVAATMLQRATHLR